MFFSSLSSGVSSHHHPELGMMSPGKPISAFVLVRLRVVHTVGQGPNVAELTRLIAVSKQSTFKQALWLIGLLCFLRFSSYVSLMSSVTTPREIVPPSSYLFH